MVRLHLTDVIAITSYGIAAFRARLPCSQHPLIKSPTLLILYIPILFSIPIHRASHRRY